MKVDYLPIHFTTSLPWSLPEPNMNLSIHLALTLSYLMGHSIYFNVMSLPSLLCSYSKISKLIWYETRIFGGLFRPDKKSVIVSKVVSFFLFSSNPKNSSYFRHRSSIQHWIKKGETPIFTVNGSNHFIDMSVLYRINCQLFIFSKPSPY